MQQRLGDDADVPHMRAGLAVAELHDLASALHDIGKIGIDEAILNKPGKLTAEEFAVIKTHSMLRCV